MRLVLALVLLLAFAVPVFAQDADASIRTQQSAVYRYLPPEFKQKTKGVLEYLNYTVKNGFTGQSFILPNGSQVLFHTYSQFIQNVPGTLRTMCREMTACFIALG